MGIINITPDSFSGDGCWDPSPDKTAAAVLRKARRLVKEGADILDVGGESTRPGAVHVPVKEEIKRVVPIIKVLAREIDIPISVDTYKSTVAERALDAGASMVNLIKGVSPDKRLLQTVRDHNAAIVLMHIRGNPKTMQNDIYYEDLIEEIKESLKKSAQICLEIGIKSDKIILDPGIGFGKTAENNLEIINRLDEFATLGYPLMTGTSRKSFIGKILKKEETKRLNGTVASVCASILRGAHIVRVHDVQAVKEAVDVTDEILNSVPYESS